MSAMVTDLQTHETPEGLLTCPVTYYTCPETSTEILLNPSLLLRVRIPVQPVMPSLDEIVTHWMNVVK